MSTLASPAAPRSDRATPEYDPQLVAFHRAFAPEIRHCIEELPLAPGGRVLDLACGDGFYTAFLAGRAGPDGLVVGADLLDGYLERARRQVTAASVHFARADVYRLPFADDTFDLAFCAQSLISLDDAVGLLREMRRVTRRGGLVVVLETDEYHHVLLPWPVDLEVTLQRAVLAGCRQRFGHAARLSPSRWLRRQIARSGLVDAQKRTVSADRLAPFSPEVRAFLTHHLQFLSGLVRTHLGATARATFDRLIDADHPDSLLNCAESELTCLNTLHIARKA
ncbi:MAG: class I SAM-dependent methyltransferase [Gemmataceae bacterium]